MRLDIVGPFRLLDRAGRRVAITSRRSRALLAMLALAPHGERTRAWLQDHLWGSRAPPQANASLRRELSTLRGMLTAAGLPILRCEHDHVALDLDMVDVDARAMPDGSGLALADLLEGIDLPGEESFEDWLREQRSVERPARPAPAPALPARHLALASSAAACPTLAILPPDLTPGLPEPCGAAAHILDCFLDRVATCLVDHGGVDVLDRRAPTALTTAADAVLRVRLHSAGPPMLAQLALLRAGDGGLVLARHLDIEEIAAQWRENRAIAASRAVVATVEDVFGCLTRRAKELESPPHQAASRAREAVRRLFMHPAVDVSQLRGEFDRAMTIDPCGTHLAWQAYLGAFAMEPLARAHSATAHLELVETTHEYAVRALEHDAGNPLSQALVAHAVGFVLRDFETAGALLDNAERAGVDHVMVHDSVALFALYTGDLERAGCAARRAATLGARLPYRYCFATSLLMVETLRGDHEAAIRHGEAALRLQPDGGRSPYAPTLRYLAVSYAKAGRHEAARETLGLLRAMEPDLSAALLDHPDYPLPSRAAAALMKSVIEAYPA